MRQTISKIQKFRLRNRQIKIITSKTFLQKVLHRHKNSYFEENSIENSENPKEIWKTLKSLVLNAEE